jgi:NCAIR mutase (PurE)-related protein
MTDFRLDWERPARTGLSEAVLCDAKSAAQIAGIAAHAIELDRRLLFTRLAPRKHAKLDEALRARLDYDTVSRTALLGDMTIHQRSRVAIVAAGTSDLPVAREAERTLRFAGEEATLVADVGVAGLWRLMEHLEPLRTHRVVIAVAGMEGALFSVIAGLVPAVVVAVPTSVGYGVAKGGRAALNAALASCASGLAVVNVDNGFGAAHLALRVLARHEVAPGP